MNARPQLLPAATPTKPGDPSPPGVLFAHAGAELYGADRILLELAGGLRERGHALQVVLPGPGPLHEALAALGVPTQQHNLGVLRRRYFSPRGLVNRAWRLQRAVRHLRRLLREQPIAVVHTHTTAVFAGALAAWWAGVPHVWHVHEITTRPRWFAALVARLVARLSQRAVFVSAATRDHLCALAPAVAAKAVVIHNGIDATRAASGTRGSLRRELGLPADARLVGMVGRINWWKGQGALLDAVERLLPQEPRLQAVLVGGSFAGEEALAEALDRRLAQPPLAGRAHRLGFREDVGAVLADLEVFVLPSTEPDPFPTVVLEAMAAGRPVVAFRHGGVCEMVEDGVTGLLCPPGDRGALAHAIGRLLADPVLAAQMGAAGRARLARHFTREVFIDRFARLYAELAAEGRR